MTMTAPPKTALYCQECGRKVMEVTGLVEVPDSGIAISRRCKCGKQGEWKVLPSLDDK